VGIVEAKNLLRFARCFMLKPIIILVQPQLAENIGMAARAMANFGLDDLRLVAPRDGWPKKGAHSSASGASWLIESAKLYATVPEAIADLHAVYATSARLRDQSKRIFTPEEIMPSIAHSCTQQHRAGIMFGPERTGLSNDDLALSNAMITFPVNPAFSSLNLAQAVLLIGYEWSRTTQSGLPAHINERSAPQPARREEVTSFFNYLEQELVAAHFFPPDRQESMMHNLMDVFHRLSMSEQDVRTLRGVFSTLVNGRRGGRNAPRPSRRTLLALRESGESGMTNAENVSEMEKS